MIKLKVTTRIYRQPLVNFKNSLVETNMRPINYMTAAKQKFKV